MDQRNMAINLIFPWQFTHFPSLPEASFQSVHQCWEIVAPLSKASKDITNGPQLGASSGGTYQGLSTI